MRLSLREVLILAALAFLLTLPGCAGTALAPETPRERIAAQWIALTHVYTLTERLYKAGDLKREDAQQVVQVGRLAEASLLAAEQALAKGDPGTVAAQLGIAEELLRKLRDRLAEKEKKA